MLYIGVLIWHTTGCLNTYWRIFTYCPSAYLRVYAIDHCGSRCKGCKSPPLIHTYIHTYVYMQLPARGYQLSSTSAPTVVPVVENARLLCSCCQHGDFPWHDVHTTFHENWSIIIYNRILLSGNELETDTLTDISGSLMFWRRNSLFLSNSELQKNMLS
jgi:hypothetical protein